MLHDLKCCTYCLNSRGFIKAIILICKHLAKMGALLNLVNNTYSIYYVVIIKHLFKMPISANWINDNFLYIII